MAACLFAFGLNDIVLSDARQSEEVEIFNLRLHERKVLVSAFKYCSVCEKEGCISIAVSN